MTFTLQSNESTRPYPKHPDQSQFWPVHFPNYTSSSNHDAKLPTFETLDISYIYYIHVPIFFFKYNSKLSFDTTIQNYNKAHNKLPQAHKTAKHQKFQTKSVMSWFKLSQCFHRAVK